MHGQRFRNPDIWYLPEYGNSRYLPGKWKIKLEKGWGNHTGSKNGNKLNKNDTSK